MMVHPSQLGRYARNISLARPAYRPLQPTRQTAAAAITHGHLTTRAPYHSYGAVATSMS
ncbi:hypothetical protein BH20ACT17_BH20ACT17_06670 [soil metagenome]